MVHEPASSGWATEADSALHFLEGKSRALPETSEVLMHDGSGSNKYGLQLCHLHRHTIDWSSAFSVVTVLEVATWTPAANNIRNIMGKTTTLERGIRAINNKHWHLTTQTCSARHRVERIRLCSKRRICSRYYRMASRTDWTKPQGFGRQLARKRA